MLKPIDRSRRDGPLYPGSAKTLRDFIDPKHLLVRIDANFDFAALTEFAAGLYDPWIGRPAVHPEMVIRALILSSVYDVTSYRQLCERIAENLAWRWFCHLALEDPVFDHSTLSVFLERLGADGFQELLQRLNTDLVELGLVSPRTYADSSLVPANANTTGLDPTDLSPAEFAQHAEEQENGTFRVTERVPAVPEAGEPARLLFHHYQDPQGRLPLSPVDPEARWRRQSKWRPAIFGYKEHLVADKSGFILARRVTPADAGDADEALPLLDRLPIRPKSLGADAAIARGASATPCAGAGSPPSSRSPPARAGRSPRRPSIPTSPITATTLPAARANTCRWRVFPIAREGSTSSPCRPTARRARCAPTASLPTRNASMSRSVATSSNFGGPAG